MLIEIEQTNQWREQPKWLEPNISITFVQLWWTAHLRQCQKVQENDGQKNPEGQIGIYKTIRQNRKNQGFGVHRVARSTEEVSLWK